MVIRRGGAGGWRLGILLVGLCDAPAIGIDDGPPKSGSKEDQTAANR